jgi:hypothetical protein
MNQIGELGLLIGRWVAVSPGQGPTPEPDPSRQVTDLERRLMSTIAAEAKWRERAVSAAARVRELEAKLDWVTAEVSHWKRRAFTTEAHVSNTPASHPDHIASATNLDAYAGIHSRPSPPGEFAPALPAEPPGPAPGPSQSGWNGPRPPYRAPIRDPTSPPGFTPGLSSASPSRPSKGTQRRPVELAAQGFPAAPQPHPGPPHFRSRVPSGGPDR